MCLPVGLPGATCANGENNTFDEDTCLVLPEWAIRSGPRGTIYFDPEKVGVAADPQQQQAPAGQVDGISRSA